MTVEMLLRSAQELSRGEQLKLLDGLTRLLEGGTTERNSITAIRGLGRELWDGIDGQDYVDTERRSWSG